MLEVACKHKIRQVVLKKKGKHMVSTSHTHSHTLIIASASIDVLIQGSFITIIH